MLVTSCGGGSSGSSSTTPTNSPLVLGNSYANAVCSIALAWKVASTTIDGYLAGKATTNAVFAKVNLAEDGTLQYIDRIHGLGQPDNAAQKAAYTSLQATATSLYDRSQAILSEVKTLKTGAKKIEADIKLLDSALRTSVGQLDKIYPESHVAAAVDRHATCEQLHSPSTG